MANMSIRATYALDSETAQHIKRLASTWDVSQAEVIRRSVRLAAEQEATPQLTPAEVIAHYANQPLLRDKVEIQRLIDSMRKLRHKDDAHRSGD